MAKETSVESRVRRHLRVREKVKGTAEAPRLSVFRSLNHIYAQVIDDVRGHTLASASTADEEIRKAVDGKSKIEISGLVGELVAKRALESKIERVAFDRGGFRYHGRVKALAEGARKGGLKF